MGYYDGNWSAGEWLAMGSMVLFWGLLIGLLVWAVGSFGAGGTRADSGRGSSTDPDELLAGRYARGEIDDDEFQRRRELLHSTSSSRT